MSHPPRPVRKAVCLWGKSVLLANLPNDSYWHGGDGTPCKPSLCAMLYYDEICICCRKLCTLQQVSKKAHTRKHTATQTCPPAHPHTTTYAHIFTHLYPRIHIHPSPTPTPAAPLFPYTHTLKTPTPPLLPPTHTPRWPSARGTANPRRVWGVRSAADASAAHGPAASSAA